MTAPPLLPNLMGSLRGLDRRETLGKYGYCWVKALSSFSVQANQGGVGGVGGGFLEVL